MQIDINKYSTILFDLGGVVMDIDLSKTYDVFEELSGKKEVEAFLKTDLVKEFEKGLISPDEMYEKSCSILKIDIPQQEFFDIWNLLLVNFHAERIEFIQKLASTHKVMLLSNTNSIHIEKVERKLKNEFGVNLKDLFEQVFLSYKMGMYKPDKEIFETVLNKTGEKPEGILFIEDTAVNTKVASELGINTLLIERNEHFYKYLKS